MVPTSPLRRFSPALAMAGVFGSVFLLAPAAPALQAEPVAHPGIHERGLDRATHATVVHAALDAALDTPLDTVGTRNRIDREALLTDIRTLAHDSMEGRRTGTPGGERARRYLVERFEAVGIPPLEGERTRAFTFTPRGGSETIEGVNVLGVIPGTVHPERYLVVTAHYDHLGVRNDEIYNGADDNASGTAALLHLAAWLRANPPRHSVILAALDAEEMGLQGARAFIADPPIPLDRVVMNLNLDMVSRNEADELYAAGTFHYPFLVPLVEEAAARSRISLLMGHDRPDLPPGDDWTMSSDHGPFHQAGIPFLYFGVEDHPGYHNPSDIYEDITPDFYLEAVETILDMLILVDRHGERILEARNGANGGEGGGEGEG